MILFTECRLTSKPREAFSNEHRNDFRTPENLNFPMVEKNTQDIRSQTHDSGFQGLNSDAHSWAREIPYLRSITRMQIWIKGVLTAEDVLLAREFGCDGVIVSNHGGRQLDGTPATIDVLQECVEAAAGKLRVHIDGGIRSGSDIFKALALGAECCWVGRPMLWGLAVSSRNFLFRCSFLACCVDPRMTDVWYWDLVRWRSGRYEDFEYFI